MTGGQSITADTGRLCSTLGITPAQATLLLRLRDEAGDFVASAVLHSTISHPHSGDKVLAVQVCNARNGIREFRLKHLRRHDNDRLIENLWGTGYRLTEAGLDTLQKALA